MSPLIWNRHHHFRICCKCYRDIDGIVGAFVDLKTVNPTSVFIFIILVVVVTLLAWSFLAQAIKRCHDCGKSGWWLLIPYYFLMLVIAEGQPGSNKYGTNPKEAEIFNQ